MTNIYTAALEATGLARLREALEAHEWDAPDNDGASDLNDALEELGLAGNVDEDSDLGLSVAEDSETDPQLRLPILTPQQAVDVDQDQEDQEEDENDKQVHELKNMMAKLLAAKGSTPPFPLTLPNLCPIPSFSHFLFRKKKPNSILYYLFPRPPLTSPPRTRNRPPPHPTQTSRRKGGQRNNENIEKIEKIEYTIYNLNLLFIPVPALSLLLGWNTCPLFISHFPFPISPSE